METKSRTWVDSARPDRRLDLWRSTGCNVPVKLSCECKGQQRICICRNSETQKQDIKWQTGYSAAGASVWRMRYDGRSSSKKRVLRRKSIPWSFLTWIMTLGLKVRDGFFSFYISGNIWADFTYLVTTSCESADRRATDLMDANLHQRPIDQNSRIHPSIRINAKCSLQIIAAGVH